MSPSLIAACHDGHWWELDYWHEVVKCRFQKSHPEGKYFTDGSYRSWGPVLATAGCDDQKWTLRP